MNWSEVTEFRDGCLTLDLDAPRPVTRAIELAAAARAHTAASPSRILDLADENVGAHVEELPLRAHSGPLGYGSDLGLTPGLHQFEADLLAETRAAVIPTPDLLIEQLQPRFLTVAAPLVTAAKKFGFTNATRSDQVIDLADERASRAWRETRQAVQDIVPFVQFRIAMSRIFGVSPTVGESLRDSSLAFDVNGVNHSISFAEGDNWATDGSYYIAGQAGQGHIDWLALALGGLRLNTPTETRMKYARRHRRG